MLTRVVVVVPAHNEERQLGDCLAALAAIEPPGVPVEVIVVLDACTDGTAGIAADAGVRTIATWSRNVGVARSIGVAAALGVDPHTTWIANTDADTQVPAHWLRSQLRHAVAGADVVAGTVTVADWANWPDHLPPTHLSTYALQCGLHTHTHVHGANLGFSGPAYRAAGGFPHLAVGEDAAFVAAARLAGLMVVQATDVPVVTSSRRVSRVDHGFAGYLRELAGVGSGRPAASAGDEDRLPQEPAGQDDPFIIVVEAGQVADTDGRAPEQGL